MELELALHGIVNQAQITCGRGERVCKGLELSGCREFETKVSLLKQEVETKDIKQVLPTRSPTCWHHRQQM